jgi:hypothetical protein
MEKKRAACRATRQFPAEHRGESAYEKESRKAEAILAKQRRCYVCGQKFSLEDCVVDEDGCGVHEQCYVTTIVDRDPTPKISNRPRLPKMKKSRLAELAASALLCLCETVRHVMPHGINSVRQRADKTIQLVQNIPT